MPTEQQHQQQVEENQQFLDQILPLECHNWSVTITFYVAVHLVEQVLARRGFDTANHLDRNLLLRDHFPGLYSHYLFLYNASRLARYYCIPGSQVDRDTALEFLQLVREDVDRILNSSAP